MHKTQYLHSSPQDFPDFKEKCDQKKLDDGKKLLTSFLMNNVVCDIFVFARDGWARLGGKREKHRAIELEIDDKKGQMK